jgi:hypothetical protein
VISREIRALSLPGSNRARIFDGMNADRTKIAKEKREATGLDGDPSFRLELRPPWQGYYKSPLLRECRCI